MASDNTIGDGGGAARRTESVSLSKLELSGRWRRAEPKSIRPFVAQLATSQPAIRPLGRPASRPVGRRAASGERASDSVISGVTSPRVENSSSSRLSALGSGGFVCARETCGLRARNPLHEFACLSSRRVADEPPASRLLCNSATRLATVPRHSSGASLA